MITEVENNPRYIYTEDRQLVDKVTGEIINKKEIQGLQVDDLQYGTNELNKELRASGSEVTYKLIRVYGEKFNCIELKKGYAFGKVFRVELRKIMGSKKLSKNSKVIIATLEPFLSFPKNTIIIDGHTPTIKELQDYLVIGKTSIYQAFSELEEQEIIKRTKISGQTIIYFNPFLYSSGGYVETDTYELFKYSQYNPSPVMT